MKIGTDISIQTCRDEGYLVMEVDKRAFDKHPVDYYCEFTQSYPKYLREEMGWKVGESIIQNRTSLTYNELYEMYRQYREEINSCCDCDHKFTHKPTVYDVLRLASDIDAYMGLGWG